MRSFERLVAQRKPDRKESLEERAVFNDLSPEHKDPYGVNGLPNETSMLSFTKREKSHLGKNNILCGFCVNSTKIRLCHAC